MSAWINEREAGQTVLNWLFSDRFKSMMESCEPRTTDFQQGAMWGAAMAFNVIAAECPKIYTEDGREENIQASTIKSRENAEPEVEGEYTVTTRPIDAFSLARKVGESMVNNRHHEESLRLNHRLEHERFLKMIAREPTL